MNIVGAGQEGSGEDVLERFALLGGFDELSESLEGIEACFGFFENRIANRKGSCERLRHELVVEISRNSVCPVTRQTS